MFVQAMTEFHGVSFCSQEDPLSPAYHQSAPTTGGHFYRNAVYTEGISLPNNLLPIFACDHYMMSSSHMDHTYETIDNTDLMDQYNGEYHRYSKLENLNSGSYMNSLSDLTTEYDKLTTKCDRPPSNGFHANGREQQRRKDSPQQYSLLELQTNVTGKGYNKLQWRKQEDAQTTENNKDGYDQIELSKTHPEEGATNHRKP